MSDAQTPQLHVAQARKSSGFWGVPEGVTSTRLRDSCSGEPARQATDLAVYRDRECLYALFSMEDESIFATKRDRDDPLWEEDVVEIFVAPDSLDRYFEIEVNPIGTLFDARVIFPGPTRDTMTVDPSWDCRGLHAAVRRDCSSTHRRTEILVAIPFTCIVDHPPDAGERWRANFYRIDRSQKGDSFDAWSPTLTDRPDFHVPARFGTLLF